MSDTTTHERSDSGSKGRGMMDEMKAKLGMTGDGPSLSERADSIATDVANLIDDAALRADRGLKKETAKAADGVGEAAGNVQAGAQDVKGEAEK